MLYGTLAPPRPYGRDERRTSARYHLRLPVNLRVERWSPAILVDLSRGGLWLRTRARAPLGNQVRVALHCHAGLSCEPSGRVVRALLMPQIGGFAVRFEPGTVLEELFAAADTLPTRSRASFLATELQPRVEISAG